MNKPTSNTSFRTPTSASERLSSRQFYASCPKSLESLLFEELKTLGIYELRETVGGVYFTGDVTQAYRACLWSRLANKVLLPLATIEINSDNDLYEGVNNLVWEDHIASDGSFKVDFIGTNDVIRNSQFGAVRIKDAIVDRFKQQANERPSVIKENPDVVIHARLSRGKTAIKNDSDKLHVSIDLSGQSLHRRGYRTKQGAAPLKENLAAALLMRARWPAMAESGGVLIDPMCGSGTLLIEGVMMAADIAPGLLRQYWGFSRWQGFKAEHWQDLIDEAKIRKRSGLQRLREDGFEARGYDADVQVLRAAESNSALAGVAEFVRVSYRPVEELIRPTHKPMTTGLVISNPPYGERLGEEQALLPVYRQLGARLKQEFVGWQAAIFTANTKLAKNMGIRARKVYKFFNGTLATDLVCFTIEEKSFVKAATLAAEISDPLTASNNEAPDSVPVQRFDQLTAGAQMVCNRLKKNQKQLRKWINKEKISSYRLYDADMPEYSAAIDCYDSWVHVQEYKAPKTIDEKKAQYRFDEIVSAIPVALGVDPEHIFIKQRRQNKGKQQYEKQLVSDGMSVTQHRAKIAVEEGPATLLVDLWSYLDSGLFLDHRPVRKMISTMAAGKRFLNLFCYTGTATVHAALGGASSSVSVDMSNTYLQWAKENFETNSMNVERHELVQQDCMTWLNQCREGFDLIFLDPPSFSNSKRMENVFDVQRDHSQLIHRCMDLLNPGGTLLFSNNLRSFTLDSAVEKAYQVNDVTAQTLDPDFQRNKKIHQCYMIRH